MAKDGENSDVKAGRFLCGFLLMNRDHPDDEVGASVPEKTIDGA